MRKTKRITTIGKPCKPIAVNRHFTLSHYPDYLNPERFVQIFQHVWREKLPLSARRPIAAYWRKEGGTLEIAEELDESLTREYCTPLAGIAGKRYLEFLDGCLLLPDQVLQFTIAHELAHLYLMATQDDPSAWKNEEEVDRIAIEWFGCDSDWDWWTAVGNVWHRYALKMFEDTRVDNHADLCHALGIEPK